MTTLVDKARLVVDLSIPPFAVRTVCEKDGNWLDQVLTSHNVKFQRIPMDGIYYLASLQDILSIAFWDWASRKAYLPEKRDCDKYARWFWARATFMFKTNNVGFVNDYSSGHAYNLVITPEEEVYLFEPQTDRLWNIKDHNFKQPYRMESGLLLL